MTDPIFAMTRHHYGSYTDLHALIELSNFPTCYIDEIDPASDNVYLIPVRNGELPEAGYPDARARLIHWCFEWDQYPPLPGISETWYPDVWAAQQYGGRYVPIGGDAGLASEMMFAGDDTASSPKYDVAFLAYMTGNRPEVRQSMMDKGVSVSPTSAWGYERHKILKRSTIYGTIHQFPEKPTMPVLRLVVAAAYKLPFITQTVHDVGAYQWGIMQASLPHFAAFVAMWAGDTTPTLANYGHDLYAHLCERFTFRQSVECAL